MAPRRAWGGRETASAIQLRWSGHVSTQATHGNAHGRFKQPQMLLLLQSDEEEAGDKA